jgi:DnaJ-class molecular chaperone
MPTNHTVTVKRGDYDDFRVICTCGWSPEFQGYETNTAAQGAGDSHIARTIESAAAAARRLCRDCRGWGQITTVNGGGYAVTEDCRRCAGTGEELPQ